MISVSQQETFMIAVVKEYAKARVKYQPFHSAHEGYAVLAEELDELWDWIRKRSNQCHQGEMWLECVQIAAMAMAFATEVGTASGQV